MPEREAELRAREVEGIRLAEHKDYDAALAVFSAIIADEPLYSSAYNNRFACRRRPSIVALR